MAISRRRFLERVVVGGALMATTDGSTGALTGPVEILIPSDGGTPRDPRRILSLGAQEFHVRAFIEEGSSPLTHPVSRLDLIVSNKGHAMEVTIHLDLSCDGTRTNLEGDLFGAMPQRDFLYIQTPGQRWSRVDGRVAQWVASFRFTVPPGETKVGLSPWYTYADYLRFIGSLADHPHLRKTLIGKSDGGREHWELAITDPSVPLDKKRCILWHSREHAYETFSSFAVEGLVDYLVSPAAALARRCFAFMIHPMINVDGVALGYEYRGGYDYPLPRGTATSRLTFGAVDRLRPHIIVTWHNWIAPRDIDVVFYTDDEDGKPTRRGWDLFTQRFPSPRNVGHRWLSETNPLTENWFGRSLSEGNVQEYAMKRYGTRVWGWEMPWYGRDEGDPAQVARQLGADFGRVLVATLDRSQDHAPSRNELPSVDVPRWEMHEFELHGRLHVENPYRDAALVGEFTAPSGRTFVVEGFHDGGDTWRLRFAPDEEGEWQYLLRGEGLELFQRGRLHCGKPRGSGFIRIHPENPYCFAYSDGTAFFPMGDTCYGLYDDSRITPALRQQYLDTRRRQRFNFVRMSVGHSPYRAAADPAFWAWGGTPERPDLDRLNPIFFRGFDQLLCNLRALGMNVELLLLNFYRRPFTDTRQWTPARERLWLRYLVARYAAFDNIFLWNLANEYETHPDGEYRLDLDHPSDVEWAKATARMVKQFDPYRHPVTVHPVISSSTHGHSTSDSFAPPWRIGEFFGKSNDIDVLSQQTSTAYQEAWDNNLQCWTGDAAGVEGSVAIDRLYGKPVLNSENGWEYLRGYPTYGRQVYHTDTVRRAAWRIVCAGGYFAAGFASTAGMSDYSERFDGPNRYPFLVKDEGAASQLAVLYDFFNELSFWRMEPQPQSMSGEGLCLALSGEAYVVYAPHGGRVLLDLGETKRALIARWFNPRNGQFESPIQVAGEWQEFQAPDGKDWVLLVK